MTPKRNSCVHFALGYTRLNMYGKGTKIDKIRERTTIDTSFDISQLNVAIDFKYLHFVEHIIENTYVKFQRFPLRINGVRCTAVMEQFSLKIWSFSGFHVKMTRFARN